MRKYLFYSIVLIAIVCNIGNSQTIVFSYDNNKNVVSITKNGSGDHIVQNTNDNGLGSLREIITDACPEDTVTFVAMLLGDTIILSGPEIDIDRSLYVLGLYMDSLTISGFDNSRIFNVLPNTFVGIEKMKLIRGNNPIDGGAILNQSQNLVLKNLVLEKNKEGTTNKALTNKGHIAVEGLVNIKD